VDRDEWPIEVSGSLVKGPRVTFCLPVAPYVLDLKV
jgi:hypothetical protein